MVVDEKGSLVSSGEGDEMWLRVGDSGEGEGELVELSKEGSRLIHSGFEE